MSEQDLKLILKKLDHNTKLKVELHTQVKVAFTKAVDRIGGVSDAVKVS